MDALILAAGLGTRLKPYTDTCPKALVEIEGKPMLEWQIEKLKKTGIEKIFINTHHFSKMLIDYVKSKSFGVPVFISDESMDLLDTGGGIVKVFDENRCSKDLLVHNVDIFTNANLNELIEFHLNSANDMTMLVNQRDSSRKLIFDFNNLLKGWHDLKDNKFKPSDLKMSVTDRELAFSGIYVINENTVKEMRRIMKDSKFGLMDYLLSKDRKCKVGCIEKDSIEVYDMGKPAMLSQARDILKKIHLCN